MTSNESISNLNMGLYYDPESKYYFRGYDKDKTTPLNKDGIFVIKDNISLKDSIQIKSINSTGENK